MQLGCCRHYNQFSDDSQYLSKDFLLQVVNRGKTTIPDSRIRQGGIYEGVFMANFASHKALISTARNNLGLTAERDH
jgi:hypothetical protein